MKAGFVGGPAFSRFLTLLGPSQRVNKNIAARGSGSVHSTRRSAVVDRAVRSVD